MASLGFRCNEFISKPLDGESFDGGGYARLRATLMKDAGILSWRLLLCNEQLCAAKGLSNLQQSVGNSGFVFRQRGSSTRNL